jgi:hypothetical protein
MPKFLMFGTDSRLQLIDDLAAIAELDVVEGDNVRSFEATWQGQTLRVETPVIRDQDLIDSRASDANFLLLVVSQADGLMPLDLAELEATPDRVELAGICFTNLIPDPELVQLVQSEITALVRRKRPRWKERFVGEDCNIFFHILKTSFFTDCL